MGVIIHNISDKTGKLAGVACVDDTKDVMVITNEGTIIRTATEDIPTYKRSTSGVKVMRLDEGAVVANITIADKEEEKDESLVEGAQAEVSEAVAQEGSAQAEENTQENKE
jgi:DNA gyrase subunit A